ncbi:MAG: permease, partial [Pseudomonadota bacterium]
VDIVYAGMKDRTKGIVNALGSLFMGIPLCWSILIVGMSQKTSIINSPVLNFETTQSGFGLYLKYMMAAFLAVFAKSMMIQFTSYLMAAVADMRGEKGKYVPTAPGGH